MPSGKSSSKSSTSTKTKRTEKMSRLFSDLLDSANQIGEYLAGKKVPGLTVKTVSVEPPITRSPADIRRLRAKFGLSQAVFAELIGVSDKAVQAWEQGDNHPNGSALRMMSILEHSPDAVLGFCFRRSS